jgi:hypothetical protein
MKSTNQTIPVIAFVIIILFFMLSGGGAITGVRMTSGMPGGGRSGGFSWMWIPAVIFLASGIFPGWAIFGKK